MLRYVLAVLLTVAILGIATVGVEKASTLRGESEVASAIATVDEAATSLLEEDVPADGQAGPRRVVEIDLPSNGYAQSAPEWLEFTRVASRNVTRVTYQFDGRAEQTTLIHAPLVTEDRESFDLSGYTGEQTLLLELVVDDSGQPVVSVTVTH